jgi:hypothetical protein
MKPSTSPRLALAVLACSLATATTVFLACSSDNSNPGPITVFDSGPGNNPDVYVPPAGDGAVTPTPEASVIDANLPDVGNCVSDASTCNSCYTPAQNPLNGCSPATVNCIPFDNTRVPSGAP